MRTVDEIRETVRELFRGTLKGTAIADDEDIFDAGATSLTVVDLQFQLEERIKLNAPTHCLMASPCVDGWVEIYSSLGNGSSAGELK